jgi:PAS domain S-box-containing protein
MPSTANRQRHQFLLQAVPWLILTAGIALSLLIWHSAQQRNDERARIEFEHLADRVLASIDRRIEANSQVLRGVEGLFDASAGVSREEFHAYVAAMHLDRHYPGIQGVGFAKLILPQDMAAHVRQMRGEGFPDYELRPGGRREIYTSIIYLEPFDRRNQRAFGYDMYSEPVRQDAMSRACDSGLATLSGKVTLVQETDTDVQAGVLLYVPMYRGTGLPADMDERRSRLIGWAYSPLRMNDLMRGLLAREHPELAGRVAVRINDDDIGRGDTLLFDSEPAISSPADGQTAKRDVLLAAQTWTVTLRTLPGYRTNSNGTGEFALLVAQLAVTWLVAILVSIVIRARARDLAAMERLSRANRETERERQRLKSIFDASSVAIFFVDHTGVVTQANKRMAEMFGCTVEALQGAEYVSLIHPSEREIGRGRMLALLASSIDAVDVERKYWRADHSEFWGHLTSRRFSETGNGDAGLIGVISDITPRRLAEQALRESEERYRLIAENSKDVIWLMDLATRRFVYVSPSVERLRGWTPEEIMAQPMEAAVTADSAQRIQQALVERMRRIAAGDDSARFNVGETDQPCKDGRIVNTEVASTVLCDSSGKPVQLLGITRDITERKLAEAELEKYRDHLEELVESRTEDLAKALDAAEAASRAKSVFLANMSHELRTPMNGIMGMNSLALRRATDPKLIEYLNKSTASARHLLALIDNVLDIANFEAGRVELVVARFSLAKLVDDVLEMHDAAVREKSLVLTAEISPNLPDELSGDATRLKQVLLNIVGNAVKFSAQGEIRLRVAAVSEDADEVTLCFEVSDQGIGLDAEARARMFELFSQGDDAPTRIYGGTGLGLVIARRIAQLMGGDIDVASEAGVGSRFRVTVRLRRA